MGDSEPDDGELSDDGSEFDPDDDPDRPWCICRKPHGNRQVAFDVIVFFVVIVINPNHHHHFHQCHHHFLHHHQYSFLLFFSCLCFDN